MLKYTLKRLSQSVVTLLLVVTFVFLLMRMLPMEGYFGSRYDKLTPEQQEAILDKMGLLDHLEQMENQEKMEQQEYWEMMDNLEMMHSTVHVHREHLLEEVQRRMEDTHFLNLECIYDSILIKINY